LIRLRLPVSAACAAALLLLTAGCAFKVPTARIQAVRLNRVDFQSVTTDFDVVVHNPNGVGLKLAGYDYDFRIEDQSLISGDQPEELRVKAKAESTVTVPVTIRFADIWNLVQATEGKEKVGYRFAAGLKLATPIGKLRIPIEKEGRMPVLKPPRVTVKSVKMDRIDLSGARFTVKMKVKNDGPSKLGVDKVDWDFSVAGSDFLSGGLDGGGALEAGEERSVTLPVEMSFADVGRSLYGVLMSGNLDYRLKGGIAFETPLGTIRLPFDLSGEAKLK
jgi:LEA14-like dessication related protein